MSKVEEGEAAGAGAGEETATAAPSTRMPTAFLSHGGGPCFFMKPEDRAMFRDMGPDSKLADGLRAVSKGLPSKPKALLLISAHWETRGTVAVTTNPKPSLVFDYYGFPDYTYELTWPAPGDPKLAARVQNLLKAADIPCSAESKRGFDHGVFVPMLLAYPEADIPTVVLSLRADLDPEFHLRMGRALAPLRDEGVYIIGSGFSSHGFNSPGYTPAQRIAGARDFNSWLVRTVDSNPKAAGTTGTKSGKGLTPEERWKALAAWERAPGARATHYREEHLLPLHVVAGAAGGDEGHTTLDTLAMGYACTMFRFG